MERMSNDLISVIVPVYNVAEYLCRCIDSICNQTYRDLEIILVNDGSTDNSGEICENYAKKDNRIKVIHKANGGLSDARNAGIEFANGNYLAFVDSDDYISEDYFDVLYNALVNSNAEMALCNFIKVDEHGNEIDEKQKIEAEEKVLSKKDFYGQLNGKLHMMYVVSWCKLFKKEVFSEIRFPVGKIHEDEFLIHHIVDKCDKIVTIDKQMYYYLQRSGSIMNSRLTVRNLNAVEANFDRAEFFHDKSEIEYSCRAVLTGMALLYNISKVIGGEHKDKIILLKIKYKKLVGLLLKTDLPYFKRIELKLCKMNLGLGIRSIRLLSKFIKKG